MNISVIVPVRAGFDSAPLMQYLRGMDYPSEEYEVLCVEGDWPSAQRNAAVAKSKGHILYFINEDSRPAKRVFRLIAEVFARDPRIAMVGGPDLTRHEPTEFQRVADAVLGSRFAHGPMCARYRQVGPERRSNERELILSNLAMRRDVFVEMKGFTVSLFPNEENELISRVERCGHVIIYHPDMVSYRPRRSNVVSFGKQFFRYGAGRMRQIAVQGLRHNMLFLLPLAFVVYMVLLLCTEHPPWMIMPLCGYILFGICDAAAMYSEQTTDKPRLLFMSSVIGLTFVMHSMYACGSACALVARVTHGRMFRKKIQEPQVKVLKCLA